MFLEFGHRRPAFTSSIGPYSALTGVLGFSYSSTGCFLPAGDGRRYTPNESLRLLLQRS